MNKPHCCLVPMTALYSAATLQNHMPLPQYPKTLYRQGGTKVHSRNYQFKLTSTHPLQSTEPENQSLT